MSSSTSQIRLLVMVLVAWSALSAAPVVATSPPLPAAFFVIGLGLVAAVTLRFSTLAGFFVAVLGALLFGISIVSEQSAVSGRSVTETVTAGLTRPELLLPVIMAAVSLVGTAVCAWLASWGIEGRPGVIEPAAGSEGAWEPQDGQLRAGVTEAEVAREAEEARKAEEVRKAEEARKLAAQEAASVAVGGPERREAAAQEASAAAQTGGVPGPTVAPASATAEGAAPERARGEREATGVTAPATAEEAVPEEPQQLQEAPEGGTARDREPSRATPAEPPIVVEESSRRDRKEGEVEGTSLEEAGTPGRPRRRPDSVRRPARRRKR